LLERWVKGVSVDWDSLYGEAKPQRAELPSYPFARDEYWIDGTAAGETTDSAVTPEPAQADKDFALIEDIISKVDASSMDTNQAVQLLKNLV
jgi:acyl transferase domain-containing protein